MQFITHKDLTTPHPNSIVWRYMGLHKFLDLLLHQRLYFTNAINFTDGYEIQLPRNTINTRREELKQSGFSGRDLEEVLAKFILDHNPMRDLTLVNCWTLDRQESYALWKIYLEGSAVGVAIRTTFSRLRKSIIVSNKFDDEEIYAGTVEYTDYIANKNPSRIQLITTKRKFYSYENELRLFILQFPQSEGGQSAKLRSKDGRYVCINPLELIDHIYISPFTARWFGNTLRETLNKVDSRLAGRLKVSSIIDE